MRHKSIPSGPPVYPLLGHLPAFLPDKLGFLLSCANDDGDVVKLKIGEPTYLLNNPEDIKYVLETNHQNYDKTPRLTSKRGKQLSGEGLLTRPSGAPHVRQRQLLQPTFHRATIASFAHIMVSSTEQMLDAWEHGAELDVAPAMMSLVQRIMGQTLSGLDFWGEAKELGEAIKTRRQYFQYVFGSLLPLPEYLPNRINREYRKAIKRIDEAIYEMIRVRRESSEPHHDMLSMLIQARYKDGTAMNDKQVHDEALTISITGYETTGEALAWTWYLLSQHPEVESALWTELQEVLDGRSPCVEDLPKLRYTEMVLAESMRLYPPPGYSYASHGKPMCYRVGQLFQPVPNCIFAPGSCIAIRDTFRTRIASIRSVLATVLKKAVPDLPTFPLEAAPESVSVKPLLKWKEYLFWPPLLNDFG